MAIIRSPQIIVQYNLNDNRKKYLTETLYAVSIDTLLDAMNNKQLSIMIFINLSKAFDSIEHHDLLAKLLRLGVWPVLHVWFRSYFADRSQYVRIETTTSLTAPLPQGSVLSLFLFSINTDRLLSIPESCCLKSHGRL